MSDTDDIENLFKNNYDALCMYSRHYVEDIYTAEDIVMDCFLKLSEKIEHGDQILAKKQYLYQMVRNGSLDTIRQENARQNSEVTVLDEASVTPENVDDLSERSEREAKLWKMIDNLPPVRREVLLMSKRDGMHNEEIADSLGISVRTVESHLYKAYHILKGKAHEIYTIIFL